MQRETFYGFCIKTSCKLYVFQNRISVVVVVLLFYVYGKHLRSCRDGQLT